MNYIKNRVNNVETLGENKEAVQEYSAATKVQRIIRSIFKTLHKVAIRAVTRILEFIVISWLAVYYIAESFVANLTPSALRSLKPLRGRTILVTGGAGGLGQELVSRLVKFKANVIVWDINEKAMAQLKEKLQEQGYKIYTYCVDLSDRGAIYKTADLVKEELGPVDILINNAGIVCGETFLNLPDYMIEKTYKVNTLSCYWTAKAFLPEMMKQGRGHIATVGSLTGFLGCYNCTDYSGSKFATVGFHESLAIELKSMGYHKIALTLVSPYLINTGMFEGCKPSYTEMLEPKEVAKRLILAIRREEEFCTIPATSNYILGLKHYIPSKLSWLLQHRVLRLPQAMKAMRKYNEVEAA